MDNIVFSLDEVFSEVRARRQSEGAFTKDEFEDLVEEVLEEKREEALLDDDADFEEARQALIARWPELEEETLGSSDDEEAGV